MKITCVHEASPVLARPEEGEDQTRNCITAPFVAGLQYILSEAKGYALPFHQPCHVGALTQTASARCPLPFPQIAATCMCTRGQHLQHLDDLPCGHLSCRLLSQTVGTHKLALENALACELLQI